MVHVQNVYVQLDSVETAVKLMLLQPLAVPIRVAVILINIFNVTISLMDFTFVLAKQDGLEAIATKLLIPVIPTLVRIQEHVQLITALSPVAAIVHILDKYVNVRC